jgi:hypothetical protein
MDPPRGWLVPRSACLLGFGWRRMEGARYARTMEFPAPPGRFAEISAGAGPSRRKRSVLLAIATVALLASASIAASSASRAGSYCPAPRSAAGESGLPIACPPRAGEPLSHALGFGAVLVATAFWAPGRRR